jgi:hypothetical protein
MTKEEIPGLRDLLATVGTNPAALQFPQDRWGFTSAIRKEVLKAASAVKGQEDKHNLLLSTLLVLITHIKARKDADAANRQKFHEELEKAHMERLPREQYSAPVKKED